MSRFVLVMLIAAIGCNEATRTPAPRINVAPLPARRPSESGPEKAPLPFKIHDSARAGTEMEKEARRLVIEAHSHRDDVKDLFFEEYGPNVYYPNLVAIAEAANVPLERIENAKVFASSKKHVHFIRIRGKMDLGGYKPMPFDVTFRADEGKPMASFGSGDKCIANFLYETRCYYAPDLVMKDGLAK
ncbi:MAG TPA: hypothetical protein VHR72_10510 [Gemmataceae bacterium]|nr:hypothetical protein [Gemmataceae bacterium]